MTTPDENIDPHSLPNLSILLTNTVHKQNNKHKAHKGLPLGSGLKESFLHNLSTEHKSAPVDNIATQLPIPSSSQSMPTTASHDRFAEETRLPISPPPEEEIRIKELTAQPLQSRFPVRSRPGTSRFSGPPRSFAQFQRQTSQVYNVESTATNSNPLLSNSRKRARSSIPPPSSHGPSNSVSAETSAAVAPSPNPKPRKQLKKHESGVYTGSGFKRRHKRGTSAESLDATDNELMVTESFKNSVHKRLLDSGVMDYTPQREHAAIFDRQGSPPKQKRALSRRSVTPDVRYEPPMEQFTPPRTVVLEIPTSITSSRSRRPKPSRIKSSVDKKIVKVKVERLTSPFPLPALDLSKPVPPPSPTDDPLLLLGPPVVVRRSPTPCHAAKKTLVDATVRVDDEITVLHRPEPTTPPRVSQAASRSPDISQRNVAANIREETALIDVAFDCPSTFDATFDPDSDSDNGDTVDDTTVFDGSRPTTVPIFDPDQSTGSHIFHSDDKDASLGEVEGEGEYTGRFKLYSVPVKEDPPSSTTRARRDSWGRPISPFPYERRRSRGLSAEPEEEEQPLFDEDSPPPSPSASRRRSATPRKVPNARWSALSAQEALSMQDKTLSEMEAGLEFRLSWHSEAEQAQRSQIQSLVRQSSFDDEQEATMNEDDRSAASNSTISSIHCAHKEPTKTSLSSLDANQFTEHLVTLHDNDQYGNVVTNAYDDDDGSSDEEVSPAGVVEVSSDDPRAAARAAAILKLHHSYIVDGLITKRARRRLSHTFSRRASRTFGNDEMDEGHDNTTTRCSRRKSIVTSVQHRPMQHSPVVQSALITPGSPAFSAVSAEDALRMAETEIRAASVSPGRPRTPVHSISPVRDESFMRPQYIPVGLIEKPREDSTELQHRIGNVREWTKTHWKKLDTCFTDERLAVGNAMGLGTRAADVDDINIEAVVERFLSEMDDSNEWDHDILLRRATALSNRQRAGYGAPPSPGRYFSKTPALKPVASLAMSTPSAAALCTIVPPVELGVSTKLPPSLLAPRYAHLHSETTVDKPGQPQMPMSSCNPPTSASTTLESESRDQVVELISETAPQTTPRPIARPRGGGGTDLVPPSATKRVLSYLGTFLGRSGPAAPPKPILRSGFNALPLPPPEMRQVARGPVNTPAKKAIPKSQPPRELVHLTEVQLPTKPSEPRVKSVLEMVSLHHIDPPRSVARPRTISRPIVIPGRTRKDSGGSVKDLVKSFEEVRKKTEEELRKSKPRPTVRKVASVGNINARAIWKP